MTNKLTGTVVATSRLRREEIEQLYQLFSRYYLNVDRMMFNRDLREKGWILLLHDDAHIVRGFTSLMVYELEAAGRRIRVAFSGSTIIEPEVWGEQELVRTWTRFMAEQKAAVPELPLYWYLICSGYRTYLFLPLFYREFYPRFDRPTPPLEQHLLDTLGRQRYPDEYRDGVIHVERPRECLRPELARPPAHKLKKPHVRFFFERNPGYARGDELACLAEFRLDNIRGFPRKIARQTLEAASCSATA